MNSFKSLLLAASICTPAMAQISYSSDSQLVTENFNHAYTGSSLGWADGTTIPGFYIYRTATTPAVPTTVAVTSGTSSGSFALVKSTVDTTNFAFGGMLTDGTSGSNLTVGNGYYIGLRLINSTAFTLNSFTLTYTGAQYANTTATTASTIEVSYQTGTGLSLATTTGWTDTGSALTYATTMAAGGATAPVEFSTTTVVKTATLSDINWAAGSEIWIRFFIDNVGGTDRGVVIDDLSFSATASAVPEPATYASVAGAVGLIGAILMRRRSKSAA